MSALEQFLMELLLELNVSMLRAEAEVKARVLAVLVLMQKDIVSLLANAPELSALGKAGKNALLRESNELIASYYGRAQLELDLVAVAEVEALGVKQALAKVIDMRSGAELPAQSELRAAIVEARAAASAEAVAASIEIRLGVALPTENYLRTLASDVLIQGSPAKNWWLRQAQDTQFKLANEIRIGAAQGETNAQIIKRIVGQEATVAKAPSAPGAVPEVEPGIPGVMPLARKNAASIVQTSVATVAAAARRKTFEINRDITNGIMQVSTLDGHTSPQCIAYSGATWDHDYEPIGDNDLPYNGGVPRHFNAVAAGEMVSTATGPKPIEMVAVGEMVLTHRGRLRPVTAVMCKRNDTGIIRIISLESGRAIRVTDEHPVLAADRGWLRADAIKAGDQLFQYQDESVPVDIGLGIDKRNPDDYPPLSNASEVFSRVLIGAGTVAASIKLDNDFGIRECEVANAISDDELRRISDAKCSQPVSKEDLSKREVGKLPALHLLKNALNRTWQRCGVVLSHPLGVVCEIWVSLFGQTPRPMIFTGHFPRSVRFNHGDARCNRSLAHFDSMPAAPSIENSLANPELALNLTNGFDGSEMLGGDKVGNSLLVSEVNHFNSYRVNDIRTVAHKGDVYNLAVQDDETYLIDGVVVHNCRSAEVPIMKTLREMGIDMDEPDPGMRASSDGPISAKTTFADYLKMKGEDYQNEVLGAGRAALFRDGKLSPRDLVDLRGRPMRLSDIKAKMAL